MREKIFPLAAALGFFLGCTDIPEELRDEAGGKCNGRAYTEYQFCASGQVYDFCSGTPYNPSIVDCCNNHQYTRETEFCSQSNIYRKCGGRQYDPASQFCGADSEIYDKCNGSPYNPETQFCYGSTIYNKCGGLIYFAPDERCENGVVVAKCGTGSNWYNPSTEQCCGNNKYATATQFCLQNSVYNKCNGKTYSPPDQRCQSNVVETECGSNWYNGDTEFCAYNSDNGYNVYNKCGGKTYFPPDQRCQSNVVETKCGSSWYGNYNSTTQFCSGNSVYDKCNGQSYEPSSQGCQSDVIVTKCGSEWYNPATQFCSSNSVYDKCGDKTYFPPDQRCQSNVVETKCGSEWYNPAAYTRYCKNGTTLTQYGSLEYSGKTYRTVEIGEQVWMAENLNYDANGSVCNNNQESNCNTYGRLYDWATAKTVCPEGWHLPSDAEWGALTTYIESNKSCTNCDAKHLKSASGWDYNGNGTDSYGFSALPGGFGDSGIFFVAGIYGFWGSSSEYGSFRAYSRVMGYDIDDAYWYDYDKSFLFSVRCLKD